MFVDKLKKFRKWIVSLFITSTTLVGGAYGADVAINPYTDKGDFNELAIVSDIPQGERVEISKDKAEMTLRGWNDSYAITITPQIPSAPSGGRIEAIEATADFDVQADRPFLSKRLEFKSGDVTAFIEPKSVNEFDIDFTLDSKPATNVFTYKISGAEDFDFFYQPPLTQKEIDEGASRPENVEGSYAVYSKTRANHITGQTNYATGKVAHIYRPKVIDANGAEVWAELKYEDGVLNVIVPQGFLDKAVYPVRVDPTFGYGAVGGTCYGISSNTQVTSGNVFFPSQSGEVKSMSASFCAGGPYSRQLAIYLASSNLLVVNTATMNVGNGWATSSVSAFVTGAHYLFAVNTNNSSQGINGDAIGDTNRKTQSSPFDTWTSPASWTSSGTAREYSIYATYTVADRTFTPGDFSYCRTMTALAGGTSGGMATTTSLPFQLVATSTIADLAATSSSGKVQLLTTKTSTSTSGFDQIPTDIVFSDTDTCFPGGTDTAIPHYFETYASTTGAFTAWMLPTGLSSTSNQTITMYYGNTSAVDLNSPPQVWATTTVDSPRAQWGLNQNPKGTPPNMLDSTYNYWHGAGTSFYSATSTVSGMSGDALRFAGGANYVNVAGFNSLAGLNRATISWWVYNDAVNQAKPFITQWNSGRLFDHSKASSNSTFTLVWRYGGSGSGGTSLTHSVANNSMTTGWNLITAVYNNGTSTAYVNGVDKGSLTGGGTLNTAVTDPLRIGWSNLPAYGFNMTFDDVRVYATNLDPMDILTIYNNTKSSTIFWSFGNEETPTPPATGGGGLFDDLWFLD